MSEPAIVVRALCRDFEGAAAVASLDFTVERGELFGLVGPDGAGKTTTLRMLAGVLRPSAGDATVLGLSVARRPEAVKHHLAYMSQRFGLYADLTVLENLHFYADLYRVSRSERRARLERLFAFSGLEPFARRLAGNLSGGMKQKLGLSCALIHQPDVLLLDEPTFGVDPISRRDLWLIVHEMVAQGVTAVVSTAYLDEAERFDRLALLDRGRLLAVDTPASLQASFDGELLEAQVEEPRRARELLEELPVVRRAASFGDRLHLTVSSAQQAATEVETVLSEAGIAVRSLRPAAPSLEDVFIERLGTSERGQGMSEPAEDAVPAVWVEELTRTFGDFVAVDRVSFEVHREEVFGFLGPNGAGKTTTIKMLAGLLLPSAGRGEVAGFDLDFESEAIKRHIGYMSQQFSLYADLTVEENIAFFSGLYGVARERRKERRDWVLEMAGLTDHRRRLTGQLSLGWKQRLALGCAVLHQPPILFLDEPTSGVDPISRRRFWDLIYALAADGTTVFVTTHYMEEAEYCHRLALMNRGSLIALDRPAELRRQVRSPLLEVRTTNSPRAAAALADVAGVLEAGMFGRSLHVAVEDIASALPRIEEALAAAGLTIESTEEIVPSLEDTFIALVREAGGAPTE